MGDTSSGFSLKSGFWKCENPENQGFEKDAPPYFIQKGTVGYILMDFQDFESLQVASIRLTSIVHCIGIHVL